MRNIEYAALGLPLFLAAVVAQAGGFAQGLGAGMGHRAFAQAAARPEPSGAQGATDSAGKSYGAATAASRMSEQGKLNGNGPDALDRDQGLSRAEDRANSHAKPKLQTRSSDRKKNTRTD